MTVHIGRKARNRIERNELFIRTQVNEPKFYGDLPVKAAPLGHDQSVRTYLARADPGIRPSPGPIQPDKIGGPSRLDWLASGNTPIRKSPSYTRVNAPKNPQPASLQKPIDGNEEAQNKRNYAYNWLQNAMKKNNR